MSAKNPKVLLLIAILALVGAALVAGCGGSSSSSSSESTAPAESTAPTEEEGASEGGTGGAEAGGGAATAEGKEVFTSNCGSCHTLKAAGTSGNVGPNLDELMPSKATVEKQVVNGGGPMPAFGKEEILAPNEIEAVSAYVSAEAGK